MASCTVEPSSSIISTFKYIKHADIDLKNPRLTFYSDFAEFVGRSRNCNTMVTEMKASVANQAVNLHIVRETKPPICLAYTPAHAHHRKVETIHSIR